MDETVKNWRRRLLGPHTDVLGSSVWLEHVCSNDCLCWASGCPCDHCRPITARVDLLITDDRHAE